MNLHSCISHFRKSRWKPLLIKTKWDFLKLYLYKKQRECRDTSKASELFKVHGFAKFIKIEMLTTEDIIIAFTIDLVQR